MSLFHLFSKPKVEKSRGYAEQGLGPTSVPSKKDTNPSKAGLLSPSQQARPTVGQNGPAKAQPIPPRSGGSRLIRARPKEPQPPLPRERPPDGYEPPPLFQAYARATKQGKLEMSTMSPEAVLHKSKNRTVANLQVPSAAGSRRGSTAEVASIDTGRQTVKQVLKQASSTSAPRADLPRKLFVLVNNGYILQYADNGPSDRLPERILPLGKHSAAFACDVIPGRHHVLQVSQTVDQNGFMVLNSGSVLSKIGIRSHAAKRVMSTLLLIMPDANEMNSWMSAIRQEIAALGGQVAIPEPSAESTSSQQREQNTPKFTPQLRSFNLTRDATATRHANVTSPPPENAPPPPPPAAAKAEPAPKVEVEDEDSDTATLDGIEMEASKLDDAVLSRPRATSDAASVASSAAPSVDQIQLDRLRGSARISHTSTANTVATSRTNSLTSSPPSDPSKASSEVVRESLLAKAPYRSLSSYTLANKRRSGVPVAPSDTSAPASGKLDSLMQQHKRLTMEPPVDSTPSARESPAPEPASAPKTSSPLKRLSMVQSTPDLNSKSETAQKHDSKVPSPVPEAESGERPVSFVADLPPPSTWTSKTASHRASLIQQSANQAAPAASPPTAPSSRRVSLRNRSTFSLPLKVNPQQPVKPSIASPKSPDRSAEKDAVSEVPVVHTLTAKVDYNTRTTISTTHIPARRSSTVPTTDGTGFPKPPSGSAKLSLFPSPPAPTTQAPVAPNIAIKRSPSSASSALPPYQPPKATDAQSDPTSFRRPASLQVRSNPAPFLSSVRNSTQGAPAPQRMSTTTVPIRGLKPSRSASTLLQKTPVSSIDPFYVAPPTLKEEATDAAKPLPERSTSPTPGAVARSSSRLSGSKRSSRIGSPLPKMDFGIPIVGLGPPAPPPSAPLPQLPNQASSPPLSGLATGNSPPRPAGLGIKLGAS